MGRRVIRRPKLPAVNALRLPELPVVEMLPELQAALTAHRAAVLEAPPGAGKSTVVPLALLDAGWLGRQRIVMLEPRRVAARAVAERMAATLGEPAGGTVGYRTRTETRVAPHTRIEVVTEGILTRRLQRDPTLEGVGCVIFDEFHERSLNADLGLALTLDVQSQLREELRVLVMSATLDGATIARLLGEAPRIRAQGRMYPVETFYLAPVRRPSRRSGSSNAWSRRFRAPWSQHTGDVLAFLPGAGEIRRTAEQLATTHDGLRIRPLYGELPSAVQDAALRPEPDGRRKLVLATNLAETSLTIEGVSIVVDGGYERRPRFDPASGMSGLELRRDLAGLRRAAPRSRRAHGAGDLLSPVERNDPGLARPANSARDRRGRPRLACARACLLGCGRRARAALAGSAAGGAVRAGARVAARARGDRRGRACHAARPAHGRARPASATVTHGAARAAAGPGAAGDGARSAALRA